MHEASTGARAIAAKQAILATAGRGLEAPERAICTSDRGRHGGGMARAGAAHVAAEAGLKAEAEALRVAILAARHAQADEDPTPRHLAMAAFDRARPTPAPGALSRATIGPAFGGRDQGRVLQSGHEDGSAGAVDPGLRQDSFD